MITITYMSWLATFLQHHEEKLPLTSDMSTLAALESRLAARGAAFALFSRADVVHAAINGSVSDKAASLTDGDEVVFFAPIAGG